MRIEHFSGTFYDICFNIEHIPYRLMPVILFRFMKVFFNVEVAACPSITPLF